MAFSSSPIKDTYSSHRIPLVQSIFRDIPTTAVLSMKNVLPFKYKKGAEENEIFVETRPSIFGYKITGSAANEVVRGMYVWEKANGTIYYFVVINTGIYTTTDPSTTWTLVTTLTTNVTTPVRFTEFISSSSTKSLVLVDGVEGYVFTSDAAGTKITDADFPTPHVPFPIFMNGRLYLAKENTGDIYNSALDNPATWTAGDFISSEIYPDDIKALVKVNNYILAIGGTGSEYFYDAANATGSPLSRQEGASLPFGTSLPNSIAYTLDTTVFIARDGAGEFSLKVIEGFQHKEIPAHFLIQDLSTFASGTTAAAKLRAYFFRQNGKIFYALAQDGTVNDDTTGVKKFTYVYSFDTDTWTEFTRGKDALALNEEVFGTNAHKTFPVYFTSSGSSARPLTYIAGHAYNGAFFGFLFPGSSRGLDIIPINNASVLTQVPYVSSVATDYYDFGTSNLKTMSRLGVSYSNSHDNQNSINNYTPRVSWSDQPPSLNGYTTPRTLVGSYATAWNAFTTSGYNFPFITQLGSFRRRWFLVECYMAVEYYHLEVDINKGQQ